MICFLKGKIFSINELSAYIDVNGIGYEVFLSRPSAYSIGEEIFLFTYEVRKEDLNYLVGFSSKEEFDMFKILIHVNGIGPKIALNILKNTTPSELTNAIKCNNIGYLKKIPGLGSKGAYQIILDMGGKFTSNKKGHPEIYEESFQALLTLGFKKTQIDKVLSSINEVDATSSDIVKIALTKLQK